MEGLARTPLEEIACNVRDGNITPEDLVHAYVEVYLRRNAEVNAIVTADVDGALRRARELSTRPGKAGSLAGLPFTVKDSIETAGIRTTAGTTALRDYVPEEDAPAVATLRHADGILLGKTNVPPLAAAYDTANRIFGRTRNPYDLQRSPGGSSGGGAAAVAAGMTAFDLASDSLGSLAIPAHFCGVTAHKPTPGRVANDGHIPPLPRLRRAGHTSGAVMGVLARTPQDVWYVMRSLDPPLSGPEGHANKITQEIGTWLDDPIWSPNPVVRAALLEAGARLQRRGYGVRQLADRPNLRDIVRCSVRLAGWAAQGAVPAVAHAKQKGLRAVGADTDKIDLAWEFAYGVIGTAAQWAETQEWRTELARGILALFSGCQVILCPAAVCSAQKSARRARARLGRPSDVDAPAGPRTELMAWPSISNLAGLPSTTVPVGMADGLPVGIQVLAAPGNDALCLGVAVALFEESAGGLPVLCDQGAG